MIFKKDSLIEFYKSININIPIFSNYLLIAYAFFLPLSTTISNALFFIVLVIFLFAGKLIENIIFALNNKIVLAILIFIMIHILWLFGSQNMEYGLDKISAISKFLYIIVFISVIRKEFILKIILAFMLSIFVSEITSYLIFFEIITPFNNATINNPVPYMLNHTAYSVVLALALGIALLSFFYNSSKHRLLQTIAFVLLGSITINILIIASRLGYVLYGVVLMVVVMIYFKKYFIKAFIVSILLIALTYIYAYSNFDTFKNRTNQFKEEVTSIYLFKDFSTSFGVRVGYYELSNEIFDDQLFFGVGTGDHIDYAKAKIMKYKYPQTMIDSISAGAGSGLHSDILDTLVQFGIFGLLSFMTIFYMILKYEQPNVFLKNIQIILVIVFLINATVQGVLYFPGLSKIFILLLSLTLIRQQSDVEKNNI